MATEQLPASQFAVGGQATLADHVVISTKDGFEEDGEDKLTQAGQFKCALTYSRRLTKSLELELLGAADVTAYVVGGYTDAAYASTVAATAIWEIRSVSQTRTRGPVVLALELVSLTDTLA